MALKVPWWEYCFGAFFYFLQIGLNNVGTDARSGQWILRYNVWNSWDWRFLAQIRSDIEDKSVVDG